MKPQNPLSFHPDSALFSLEYGKRRVSKNHFNSYFSKNIVDEIIRVMRMYKTFHKDDDFLTKSDMISVPFEFFQENANKRTLNKYLMQSFANYYFSIKAHYFPIMSVVNAEFEIKLDEERNESGHSFASDYLSCEQWILLKKEMIAALAGDKESLKKINAFLTPSFEYAEKSTAHMNLIIDQSDTPSIHFSNEKINGFLRLDSNGGDPHYYRQTHVFVSELWEHKHNNLSVIVVKTTKNNHVSLYGTLDSRANIENGCTIENWMSYMKSTTVDGEPYPIEYDIYVVDRSANKSQMIGNSHKLLDHAMHKAKEIVSTLI